MRLRTIKKYQRANSLFIAAAKSSDHDIYFIPISIYCSAIPDKNAKANRSHSRHSATHLVLLYTETANHCRKLPPGISKIWKTGLLFLQRFEHLLGVSLTQDRTDKDITRIVIQELIDSVHQTVSLVSRLTLVYQIQD